MSIFYIDLDNGNNSNAGTSWALAWKTITNGATAARIASGDIIRISKTPDPVSIGNATWTDGSNTVTLATAQTLLIDDCESGWVAGTGGDATVSHVASSFYGKSGSYALKMVLDSAVQVSKLQAYKTLPATLDLSSYQKICFWVRSSGSFSMADRMRICLCSDSVGQVIVDSFLFPAYPTLNYVPLVLAKNGGGNLGSNINSIAIYSGSVAPIASSTLYFDNFNACLQNGLSLQSLISRNGSAQGGEEGFFPIQSIIGTAIVLDGPSGSSGMETSKNKYYTLDTLSGPVATYRREAFHTDLPSGSTTVINTINDSGYTNSYLEYQFGYEVGTENQNGETHFDGLCGWGYGLYASGKSYIKINHCSFYRYYTCINLSTCYEFVIVNIENVSNASTYNFYSSNCRNFLIDSILSSNFAASYNFYLNSSTSFRIRNITKSLGGNVGFFLASSSGFFFEKVGLIAGAISQGISLNISAYVYFNEITLLKQCQSSIYFSGSSDCKISNAVSTATAYGVYITGLGINYLDNVILNESTEVYFSSAAYELCGVWSKDHDKVVGANKGFFYGRTYEWQTSVKRDEDIGAWKIVTLGNSSIDFPFSLLIAEIPGIANSPVTLKAWVKKQVALGIVCRLIIRKDVLLGIMEDIIVYKADDTNWEELTISATATANNPVIRVYLETYPTGSYSYNYLGSVTIN